MDLAGDVALEAAHDLALRFAFASPPLGVGAGAVAVAKPADGDQVQRAVGLTVAARVEAMTGGLARGGRDRACAAERREGPVAVEAIDVLAGSDEELAGVTGRDSEQLHGAGRRGCDELLEVLVKTFDLVVE